MWRGRNAAKLKLNVHRKGIVVPKHTHPATFIYTMKESPLLRGMAAKGFCGTVTHDNELSPGDDEIKKTSVSSVTSVAKSNFMAGKR
jgi:hypothetical protein